MKKILVYSLLSIITVVHTNAQDAIDAIRYGFQQYTGTARSAAIGNAGGSIGADIGSVSINPAGVALYRKSEISFTPQYQINNNDASYLKSTTYNNKNKLNFSELGVVLNSKQVKRVQQKSKWKTCNVSITGTRIVDYNTNYSYTGANYNNSLFERFADDFNNAGGYNDQSLQKVNTTAFAAWSTYLIDKDYAGDTTKAKAYVPYTDGLNQTKTLNQSGGIMNYQIAVGANYMEKLLVGASLSFDNLKYNSTFTWKENDLSGKKDNYFNYATLTETNETNGSGINLKLGATAIPSKNLRIGFAIHTPTHYEITSQYNLSMETDTDSLLLKNGKSSSIASYQQDSTLVSQYAFNSPFKAIASATILLQKMGFITADIEYVDYSNMKFKFSSFYSKEQNTINTEIKNTYNSAMNFRVGAEIKLGYTYIRGGMQLYGSPTKNTNINAVKKYSLGLGYRGKDSYIDFAYIYGQQHIYETPYTLQRVNANVQNASIITKNNTIACTIGFKF